MRLSGARMKPRWAVPTAAMALVAIVLALAPSGISLAERAQVAIQIPASHASIAVVHAAAAEAERVGQVWSDFRGWIADNYRRAPALVLGLGALIVLPPLAMLGLLLRWSVPAPEPAGAAAEPLQTEDEPPRESITELVFQRPAEAWIEVEGVDKRQPLGRGMLRIGREDDNDLQLLLKTVHRYHAVIHRTADAYYVITDLSSADGNGVILNGTRVSEARLKDGDTVQLGDAVLRFGTKAA